MTLNCLKFATSRTGRFINYSMWLMMFLLLASIYGPRIEARLFPVIKDFRVLDAAYRDGEWVFDAAWVKVRDCKFIGVEWYVGVYNEWFKTASFKIDDYGQRTRPIGHGAHTGFRLKVPAGYEDDPMFVLFQHNCHPAWISSSPIALPPWKP